MAKKFLTFEQQIELLRDTKGLLIDDIDFARAILGSNNYYRLNAYFHQYLVEDKFVVGTSFNDIVRGYETDQLLRQVLRRYLEKIEIKARCQIGHELGRAYGPNAFFECDHYKNAAEWEKLLESFKKATSRDDHDPVANQYYNDLSDDFEVWVVVEYLSFGELSRLFGICDTIIQAKIATSFGVHETLLKSWLESLAILRNVCAHYGYLRQRDFPTFPATPRVLQPKLGIINRLYSHVIAICWLLEKKDKESLITELSSIQTDWSVYGFPENWKEHL